MKKESNKAFQDYIQALGRHVQRSEPDTDSKAIADDLYRKKGYEYLETGRISDETLKACEKASTQHIFDCAYSWADSGLYADPETVAERFQLEFKRVRDKLDKLNYYIEIDNGSLLEDLLIDQKAYTQIKEILEETAKENGIHLRDEVKTKTNQNDQAGREMYRAYLRLINETKRAG